MGWDKGGDAGGPQGAVSGNQTACRTIAEEVMLVYISTFPMTQCDYLVRIGMFVLAAPVANEALAIDRSPDRTGASLPTGETQEPNRGVVADHSRSLPT